MAQHDGYWRRYQRKGVTRRALLRGAALGGAGLAAAAVLGCEEEAGPAPAVTTPPAATTAAPGTPAATPTPIATVPPPPSYSTLPAQRQLAEYHWSKIGPNVQVLGTPRLGNVIVVAAIGTGPTTLHPMPPTGGSQLGTFYHQFTHSTLVTPDWDYRKNPDLTPPTTEYALSEKFEVPDPTTFIFTLRKGITFNDLPPANGAPLTIDDIRVTHEKFKAYRWYAPLFAMLKSIEEPQPGVVRITTSEPAVQFLSTLQNPSFGILNARHIEEGDDALANKDVGTGPYLRHKFEPNVILVYKKRANWWYPKDQFGNQVPYIDGWASKPIRDVASALAAFRTKQVDYYRPINAEEFDRVLKELDTWGQVGIQPHSPVVAVNQRNPIFRDVRVRRALSLALNRQEILDTALGGAGVAMQWIPYFFRGRKWPETWDEMGPWYRYDPQGARNLLREAGVPEGQRFEIQFLGRVQPGGGGGLTATLSIELVQKHLKAVGIELDLKPLESTAVSPAYYGNEWTGLFNFNQVGYAPDGDIWAQTMITGSPTNGMGVSDATIDDLFKKQRAEVNVEERQKIFQRLEVYVNQEQLLRGAQLPHSFGWALWHKHFHNIIESNTWYINGAYITRTPQSWLDEKAPQRNIDSL